MNLLEADSTIRNVEQSLTQRARSVTDYSITDAAERRNWRERIEEASGGRNTVLYNDENMPSVMVRVPSVATDQLDAQFSQAVHPAFIAGGSVADEVWIGKYQAIVATKNGTDYALSLRGVDPAANIDFDDSLTACFNNGAGHHLMTTAEWAYIHLWSYMNDWEARGNTNNGSHHVRDDEQARYSRTNADRTATGTGPMSWSHDGSPFGIFDMVGNVREWTPGLRLVNGEIQIIANNDAALAGTDHSELSSAWQAILEDGSLVAPGSAGTLKHDATSTSGGDVILSTSINNTLSGSNNANSHLRDTQLATGVTIPDIAKLLQIYPHQQDIPTGRLYIRNQYSERLPHRGGDWGFGSYAGLSYCTLGNGRGAATAAIGCRPAYVNL